MKKLAKTIGLTIPAIKRLYEDRNKLDAANRSLVRAMTALRNDLSKLDSENRSLVAAIKALSEECEKMDVESQCLVGAIKPLCEERNKLDTENRSLTATLEFVRNVSCPPLLACKTASQARGKRAYAIIGSAGRTATHWLTAAFNLHKRVFFSHGPDLEPCKYRTPCDANFLRIAAQMGTFDFNDKDRYFDLLERHGDFVAFGNVHGLTPPPANLPGQEFRRHYLGCGVVRNPVKRIQSFINRWRYESTISTLRRELYSPDYYVARHGNLLAEIADNYDVKHFDETAILFLRALDTMVKFDRDLVNSGLPIFQMERLVGDIDYFLDLFEYATGGLVEPDDDFLARLQKLPPVDRRQKPASSRSVFAAWLPWQQRLFCDRIAGSGLVEPYNFLGYNLTRMFARLA